MIPFVVLICAAHSCQQGNGHAWFVIRDMQNRSVFHLNDTLHLEITGSRKGKKADSAKWFLDGKPLGVSQQSKTGGAHMDLPAQAAGLGTGTLSAQVWLEGKPFDIRMEIVILSDIEPATISYEIVNTYPHDTSAYTQGLFYTGMHLVESTGRKGESKLRKTSIDGKVIRQVALAEDIFGEGACLLDGKIYQLSWKGQKGFIYTTGLDQTGEFPYPEAIDGWGLTTDGRDRKSTRVKSSN